MALEGELGRDLEYSSLMMSTPTPHICELGNDALVQEFLEVCSSLGCVVNIGREFVDQNTTAFSKFVHFRLRLGKTSLASKGVRALHEHGQGLQINDLERIMVVVIGIVR